MERGKKKWKECIKSPMFYSPRLLSFPGFGWA